MNTSAVFGNILYVVVVFSYSVVSDSVFCSSPGSSVPGIFQARILEWVAISFSRGSFQPRDWTHISFIGRWILYCWVTREDLFYVYALEIFYWKIVFLFCIALMHKYTAVYLYACTFHKAYKLSWSFVLYISLFGSFSSSLLSSICLSLIIKDNVSVFLLWFCQLLLYILHNILLSLLIFKIVFYWLFQQLKYMYLLYLVMVIYLFFWELTVYFFPF